MTEMVHKFRSTGKVSEICALATPSATREERRGSSLRMHSIRSSLVLCPDAATILHCT